MKIPALPVSDPLITMRMVGKTYRKKSVGQIALRSIDLDIQHREFCTLRGPSGSGKSTLLNVIASLDRPSTGQYLFDSKDLALMSDNELSKMRAVKIGFVFQSFNLLKSLSVLDNVLLQPRLASQAKAKKEYANFLLERFGIFEHRHKRPDELSGGQQQRVAIARALIMTPLLLVADEPTANLDSKSSAQILQYLQEINRELKTTLLIATHDPEVSNYANRIIQIKDGVIDET